MATFHYEVSRHRKADGTYLVSVRMTHGRRLVRRPTSIFVTRDQLSRDGKRVKDAAVLDAVERLLGRLRAAVGQIDCPEAYDAPTLWEIVQERLAVAKGFRLDFIAFSEQQLEGMERGTAQGYKYSINAFKKFLGRDAVDVNGIDKLTTYYARHSWATIARNECGVDRDTVNEALNHASRDKVTDIYIARDWRRVWEANRKVLTLVFG